MHTFTTCILRPADAFGAFVCVHVCVRVRVRVHARVRVRVHVRVRVSVAVSMSVSVSVSESVSACNNHDSIGRRGEAQTIQELTKFCVRISHTHTYSYNFLPSLLSLPPPPTTCVCTVYFIHIHIHIYISVCFCMYMTEILNVIHICIYVYRISYNISVRDRTSCSSFVCVSATRWPFSTDSY